MITEHRPDLTTCQTMHIKGDLYKLYVIASESDNVEVIYDKRRNTFNATYLINHCEKANKNDFNNWIRSTDTLYFIDQYAYFLRGKNHYSYNGKSIFIKNAFEDAKPIPEIKGSSGIKVSMLKEEQDNIRYYIGKGNTFEKGIWLNYGLLPELLKSICFEYKYFLDRRFLEKSGLLDMLQPHTTQEDFVI